jgi:hypothetical protein
MKPDRGDDGSTPLPEGEHLPPLLLADTRSPLAPEILAQELEPIAGRLFQRFLHLRLKDGPGQQGVPRYIHHPVRGVTDADAHGFLARGAQLEALASQVEVVGRVEFRDSGDYHVSVLVQPADNKTTKIINKEVI